MTFVTGDSSQSRSSLSARLDGIGHVIRDLPLQVPAYQRGYAWGNDQVRQLWDDLRASMMGSTAEYFVGTVVLSRNLEDRRLIIDGQQRLATVSLLFAAIRDEFLARGDRDRALVIETGYLTYRSLRTGMVEPRLRLGREDAGYFAAVLAGNEVAPDRASHRRIRDAMSILRAQLAADVEAAGTNWDARLLRWVDFLEEDLRVILVTVPSDADAFLFFETLNDRGIRLSTSDLLKNYLYSVAADRFTSVEDAWTSSVRALDSSADEELHTNFVRQYWSSLHGATRERSLYREIRRQIRGPEQALDLAQGLSTAAPIFAALQDPDHDYWKLSEVSDALVSTILRLRLEQHRPLLLAGLQTMPTGDAEALLRAVISWSVRGIVVGGIGGGTSERYYADAAVRIRDGESQTVDEVATFLSPIIPTDAQFEASFASHSPSKQYLAKYYLLALQSGREPGGLAVGRREEEAWVLRRIFTAEELQTVGGPPQRDVAESLARRLGNLGLVPTTEAAAFETQPLDHRISFLLDVGPELLVTDPSPAGLVEARQQALARRATQTWRRA